MAKALFGIPILLLAGLGIYWVSWGNRGDTEPLDPGFILEVPAANSWDGPQGKDKALIFLKGVTLSSNANMALIGSGTAYYPFTNGEAAVIRSPQGRLAVLCESINTNEVVVRVDLKERKYRLTLLLPTE